MIKKETEKHIHWGLGMFVLVLMSHGGRDNVISDSNNQPVSLVNIQDMLSPKSFPAMKGKPKLMIIQACSGGKYYGL